MSGTILANTEVPPATTFAAPGYTGISHIKIEPTPWISVVKPGSQFTPVYRLLVQLIGLVEHQDVLDIKVFFDWAMSFSQVVTV